MVTLAPYYAQTSERVNHPLIPKISQSRIQSFFSSPVVTQNVGELLDRARTSDAENVQIRCWSAPGSTKPTFEEALQQLKGACKSISPGHVFGPAWTNHWLRVDLIIPSSFTEAKQDVIFEFDPSCEALIYSEQGEPLHAISGTSRAVGLEVARRLEHLIPTQAVKQGRYICFIEVTCNGMFGCGMDMNLLMPPGETKQFPLLTAAIVLPSAQIRGLHQDFQMLQQVSKSTSNKTSALPKRALRACDDIMSTFLRDPELEKNPEHVDSLARKCRAIAWEVLGDPETHRVLPATQAKGAQTKIWAIGHCHIDTAWLWRYTQTQQKVARSWTTQCDLMDRWKTFEFAASSAQQYLWLEQLYPSSFDRVKQYIDKGRFHPVGGAWLEHDCLLPSGESLIRQYLYGQRYFKSRFGNYCREAWLPDTFGYASQLPQILRSAGINYFFTQKLSWNNITEFPYTTFNWVALDGTQVLSHMTPVNNYSARVDFEEIEKSMYNHKNLDRCEESLMLFGNGDGGGGPVPEHLERLDRIASLAATSSEVPLVTNASPSSFFDHICEKTQGGQLVPTWRGELYLEFHRGTYTTQANIKKGNRRMEQLLRDLEIFASIAALQDANYQYPKSALDEMWQDTMLNQFHDVLPGSTISMVVDDALDIYQRRSAQARELIEAALRVLHPQTEPANSDDANFAVDALHLGRPYQPRSSSGQAYQEGNDYVLANADLKAVFRDGRLASLVDLALEKELLAPGPDCQNSGLMLYDDYPLVFDAWDVEIYHLNTGREILFDTFKASQTPGGAGIEATAKFGQSSATVTFSLLEPTATDERSMLQVKANVSWAENHKVLKFALPLDIHSPRALYGTQFGLEERPTHRNELSDQAKFEVCAHMFADLSEPGYGVTLASAYKYGYAIESNTMRLSLLRAPKSPDAGADRGNHEITFAIIPHLGPMADPALYKRILAYTNADSVYLRKGHPQALPQFRFQGKQCQSLILETVKMAEDSDSLILRLYECLGNRTKGSLLIGIEGIISADWTNILEDSSDECRVERSGDGIRIQVSSRPFEIKTLRLRVGRKA